jgi:hypothetical protein
VATDSRFGIVRPVSLNVSVDDVPGWLDQKIAWGMTDLIRTMKPDVVVELGVYGGKSLIVQAAALRDNGNGKIYGIDPWRNKDVLEGLAPNEDPAFWRSHDMARVHDGCMRAIWQNKLENVVIIRAPAHDARDLFAWNSIDVLYIDDGHSEKASCRDVLDYLPRVRGGGYIWIDDADWPSIRKACELLRGQCTLQKDYGFCHLYQKTFL